MIYMIDYLQFGTSQCSQLEDVFRLLNEGKGHPVDRKSQGELQVTGGMKEGNKLGGRYERGEDTKITGKQEKKII